MKCPLISVLMCTYNGSQYIRSAIDSILRQTYKNFELVIVDDGSTDATREHVAALMRETGDPRIRLVVHDSNKGYAGAINTALGEVRTPYFMHMDHDDIAMPRRIEQSLAFLEARPDLDGCGAGHVVLGPSWLNPLKIQIHKRRAVYHPPAEVAASTLFGGLLYTPTTCLRSSVLQRLDSWHNTSLFTGSDDDFYERLSETGARFAILPHVVLQYRRHPGNLSRKRVDIADAVRTHTARRAVLRLVPAASPEQLALHDRILLRDKTLTVTDLPAVRDWFSCLLAAPLDSAHYDSDTLRQVLARHWQRMCALAGCHNFFEGLSTYRSFSALSPYTRNSLPLVYQCQRRAVAHLMHRR